MIEDEIVAQLRNINMKLDSILEDLDEARSGAKPKDDASQMSIQTPEDEP